MSTLSIRNFRATAFAAVLAVVSLAPASHAQDQKAVGVVNVPFAFETGYRHFEPGSYTIRMESPNIVAIKGTSGTGFVLTQSGGKPQPATKSKVFFRKSGDQYFLGEIWIAEKSGHLDVIKSQAESRLQVAGRKSAPTGVELALLETVR
jgi:hypothetical protein